MFPLCLADLTTNLIQSECLYLLIFYQRLDKYFKFETELKTNSILHYRYKDVFIVEKKNFYFNKNYSIASLK